MKDDENMEIENNEFLRQFETRIDNELVRLEYSVQPRKIFLTKFTMNDDLKTRGIDQKFLTAVFDQFIKDEKRVVPTCPEVAKFFKAHRRKYKKLLPTGISI